MKQVRVVSTGSCLPGAPIDNETVARLAGPLPDDILEGLQVKTRHWVADPETGEHPVRRVVAREELYKKFDPNVIPDLFITNNDRLGRMNVPGIQFIVSLQQAFL